MRRRSESDDYGMPDDRRLCVAVHELVAAVDIVEHAPGASDDDIVEHLQGASDDAHLLPTAELKRLASVYARVNYDSAALSHDTIVSAAETLVQCLPCAARPVRRCAVRLLHLLVGASGEKALQRSVPRVVDLLGHREWGTRATAIETLKLVPNMIDRDSSMRLVLSLTHQDWGVRQVALEALALLDPEALAVVAVPMLSLLNRLDWEVRRGALRLLATLNPGSLAPLASTIYDMRATMGAEVDHLLRPAAASMIAVPLGD